MKDDDDRDGRPLSGLCNGVELSPETRLRRQVAKRWCHLIYQRPLFGDPAKRQESPTVRLGVCETPLGCQSDLFSRKCGARMAKQCQGHLQREIADLKRTNY